jgi:hypothetical protein
MRFIKTALATAALLAASLPSHAAFTLDFEGVGDLASIAEFYNGGTDSVGNHGTNYGVSFGSDALGLIDSDKGGSYNGDAHSPKTVMFFLNNTAVLNFASGFDTGFSFYFSTPYFGGSVSVYSDVDKGGTLLGTIDLPINGPGSGPGGPYSNWTLGSLAFAGTAKSIDFSGTANYITFDDVTFGSTVPVPEPETYALMGLGLGVLAFVARRRRAAR